MPLVHVKPELLRWACERSRKSEDVLKGRFPSFEAWMLGQRQPTLKQLEQFAAYTHTPIGYLFLGEPPHEQVPIPDLRTRKDRPIESPSADLLDTIYLCQSRQDWYREFADWMGEGEKKFVGSVTLDQGAVSVANDIRRVLGLQLEELRALSTLSDARRYVIERAEEAGVLTMISGIVGSNSHRRLDADEFRGFALADRLAPLVFVNGSDSQSAQMFTLAHELCHLWLGESALSNPSPDAEDSNRVESFCNAVAAELFVPLATLKRTVSRTADLSGDLKRLARTFKVSTLVVLRRLRDAGLVSSTEYWTAYRNGLEEVLAKSPKQGGGDFYATLGVRVGKRFARAMVVSTLEGRSSFPDAYRMLGFSTMSAFDNLGRKLGVLP